MAFGVGLGDLVGVGVGVEVGVGVGDGVGTGQGIDVSCLVGLPICQSEEPSGTLEADLSEAGVVVIGSLEVP